MSERYTDLTKIPADPPAKLLAAANLHLQTPLEAPASAPAAVVLAELEAKQAWVDLLMTLSAVLFGDPTLGVPSADEWGEAAGTINYEIVTRIGRRVPRVYGSAR